MGSPPFTGAPLDIAAAPRHRPLPPLPRDVPAGVATLVTKLTAKDPRARPSSADQVSWWAFQLRDTLLDGPGAQPRSWPAGPVHRDDTGPGYQSGTSLAYLADDGYPTPVGPMEPSTPRWRRVPGPGRPDGAAGPGWRRVPGPGWPDGAGGPGWRRAWRPGRRWARSPGREADDRPPACPASPAFLASPAAVPARGTVWAVRRVQGTVAQERGAGRGVRRGGGPGCRVGDEHFRVSPAAEVRDAPGRDLPARRGPLGPAACRCAGGPAGQRSGPATAQTRPSAPPGADGHQPAGGRPGGIGTAQWPGTDRQHGRGDGGGQAAASATAAISDAFAYGRRGRRGRQLSPWPFWAGGPNWAGSKPG